MDRSSALVALGILCSRLTGLIRQRFFARYFGLSDAADAFMAAFRIPNFLQNLFGEGALSASFIPVYAALVARGERAEAERVAGAVAALLSLVTAILVVAGVFTTPLLVAVIAPGFDGEKRELTIAIVRVLFPGAGLLVLSAWCLGILNSHRQFLLSYIAPVIWNVAMIATLLWWGNVAPLPQLAVFLAFGALAGSALQMLVQMPAVMKLVPHLRLRLELTEHVRTTVRNFVPVFVSRGVVQISAYVDAVLASLLPTGAVTGLANAQVLYTLPVSLFGMSVSAAALPEMSGAVGLDAMHVLRDRLNTGLRQIAFLVVPSAVVFLTLGDVVSAALFQTGRFTYADAVFVWGILAGSAIGLLATTLARLYSSTYYALRDTRTPLRYALVHVGIATVLGYLAAIVLPPMLGIDPMWGTVGLTSAASLGGWVELMLLRRSLNQRIGDTGLPFSLGLRLWSAAFAAAAVGWGIKWALPAVHPIARAVLILFPFGAAYFVFALMFRVAEARRLFARASARKTGAGHRSYGGTVVPFHFPLSPPVFLTVPELNRELAIALVLPEVICRRHIGHVRRERDTLRPAQHLEQFAVLRVLVGKHALEDVCRRVVDERLLQVQQGHLADPFVALLIADRQRVRAAANRKPLVLLDPAVSEERLRAVPIHLHGRIRQRGRRVRCRIEQHGLGDVPDHIRIMFQSAPTRSPASESSSTKESTVS